MVVAIIVVVIMVVVVTVMVIVAEAVMVPAMVMLEAAVWTIPITHEVVPAFPARAYPMSSPIRRTRPVTLVPDVAPADGIPVTVDPEIARPRSYRVNSNHARWRRSTDGDAHRHLRVDGRTAKEKRTGEQGCAYECFHRR